MYKVQKLIGLKQRGFGKETSTKDFRLRINASAGEYVGYK
jgi:hypothetical protein